MGKTKNKKSPSLAVRILKGIGTWFACMLLITIIGTVLNLQIPDGIISTIYSLTVLIVPILLAFKVAAPEKMAFAAPAKDTEQEVNDIVKALHENTIRETYGDEYADLISDEDDAEDNQVASELDTTSTTAATNTKPAFWGKTTASPHKKKPKNVYVLNPKTMVFHRQSCQYAQKTMSFNKSSTDSRSAAIAVGYKPCKYCKP